MTITGKVFKSSDEDRDLVGKDGTKKKAHINHVVLISGDEIVNLRGYDCDWPLPKVGSEWTSPRVRRYENYDGNVAEVMV